MDLIQLKYFKALAETENLTRTAEKLYLSAPALSGSIGKLERELGVSLFDRSSGKTLRLNDKGRILLASVNQIFDILDNTKTRLQELNETENLSLSIAVASPMLYQDLFIAFRSIYPEIRISHTYLNLNQISDEEFLKQFDFLIAPPEDVKIQTLQSVTLYDNDKPVVMVYPGHPFADRTSIDVQELRDVPFVAVGKDISSRKMFDQIFALAGFSPKVVYECDHLMRDQLVKEKQGLGISTLYAMRAVKSSRLHYVPLDNCSYSRKQNLFYPSHRTQTKAALLFQKFSVEYYQKLSEK